jgi:hypothetical protein
MIAFSIHGVPIRLTKERINHIVNNHIELVNKENEILETINNPEIIQQGDAGSLLAIKKFDKTPVTDDKYLVVVYKEASESDGFVLTAYYSSDLKRRVIIWKS